MWDNIFETVQPNEHVQVQRKIWLGIFSVAFTAICALTSVSGRSILKNSNSDAQDDLLVTEFLYVSACFAILIAFAYTVKILPIITLKSKTYAVLFQGLFEILEPIGVVIVIIESHRKEQLLCYILVVFGLFVLALLQILLPFYDFNLPTIFVVSAIHISWDDDESFKKGNFRQYILYLAVIFFILKSTIRIAYAEVKEEESWRKSNLFNLKTKKHDRKKLRHTWVVVSFVLSFIILAIHLAYLLEQDLSAINITTLEGWWFIVLILLQVIISSMNFLSPMIKLRSNNVSKVFKGLVDLIGALSTIFITINTQHVTPLLCFLYASIAAYSVAFFQVALPLYDLNIPSVLAASSIHLAWKESPTLTGKTWRWFLVGVIIFIFVAKAFIRIICDNKKSLEGCLVQRALAFSDTEEWKDLKCHVDDIKKAQLCVLMRDNQRCEAMIVEFDGILLDFSRQLATLATIDKLWKLAEAAHLKEKIGNMFIGEKINSVALRASRDAIIQVKGKNIVPDVWKILDKIRDFSEMVRSGSWVGAAGKALTDVIAIGIGGSFSGPLFVHTALQNDREAVECAKGRQLRFLTNVNSIDVAKDMKGLTPETTLVVVSKTFKMDENMSNAQKLREWISSSLGPEAVAKHMVAVSTDLTLVQKLGIDPSNAFVVWDWVEDQYSVCSAVGLLPLSLQYGFSVVEKFLKGASSIDQQFRSAPFSRNIPVILGLLNVWNVTFLGHPARAILPYSQVLEKLAPHIRQVSMESNVKGVSIDGVVLPYETGEIAFGEPGTNGQHNFYQLTHQGSVISCDFIGVTESQQSVYMKGEVLSNHDELMSNFFTQPDALVYGKTALQLQEENVPELLVPDMTFCGNRPSVSLLLRSLTAYNIGQLLAIYEHRIAVEGFIWGINSFNSIKLLASPVRKQLLASRMKGEPVEGFNLSTTTLLNRYLQASTPKEN